MTTTTPTVPTGGLARVVGAIARNPWQTIVAWVIAIAVVIGSAGAFGGTLVDEFTIPDADSQRALDLLEEKFPARSGENAQAVFAAPEGESLEDPGNRAAVEAMLAEAAELDQVVEVGDPYAGMSGQLSDDGRIAFADVQYELPSFEVDREAVPMLEETAEEAVEGTGIQVEFTGPVVFASEAPENSPREFVGVIAALVILLVVFGAVVAAVLPIGFGLLSVGLGLSVLTIAAAFTNFNTITPVLALMIGLGVGIDYSLFIVTRFRHALHDGLEPREAATLAAATAGRAVIFAGLTVAISITGLAFIGLDFITKMGFGAAMSVVTAVLVAVTLLPAVLALLGHRVDRLKVPFVESRKDADARERSLPMRWARTVTRHYRAVIPIVLVALLIGALPLAVVRLGFADAGTNPADTTTRQAYDLLAEGFGPGFNGPLLLVVDQTEAPGAGATLAEGLRETEGIANVPPPAVNEAGDTAIVTAFPTTSPQSEETAELVDRMRDELVPDLVGDTGAVTYVGGQTAAFDDISSRIFSRMPLTLLFIIGVTLLLLTMAFRSVVIAIKAALTTLLSALFAFGVLVAVFQEGYGLGLVGLDQTGPIESFLPIIVFAILFGLSMDYEVFLMSRVREEYVRTGAARPSIVQGVGSIGPVVIAAALIMGTVFAGFILGESRGIKEFGFALGVAILVDALIVRMTLVPALMHWFGDKGWWIPDWLDRALPGITIEAPAEVETPRTEAS